MLPGSCSPRPERTRFELHTSTLSKDSRAAHARKELKHLIATPSVSCHAMRLPCSGRADPGSILMTNSKQLVIDSTLSEPTAPTWLMRLRSVLEELDPAYAWRFYKAWRNAGKYIRDPKGREIEVVYCQDPEIVVKVKRGVWSLVCTFEPRRRKSPPGDPQQMRAIRKRLSR
jgi:hypothetical protein